MTPHPHAEFIKAWADGQQIEFRLFEGAAWSDIDRTPAWRPEFEYRIKPQPKLVTQELHLFLPGGVSRPITCDEYPANVRMIFQDGKLIDVELIVDE